MIKKLILCSPLLSLCIMITEAVAKPQMCPFTDNFTVIAPSGYVVKSLFAFGNITTAIKDPTHFKISCKSDATTENGQALLIIGTIANECTLIILDGPYENNPSVISSTCTKNLKYIGMNHAWGTYQYKLNFVL